MDAGADPGFRRGGGGSYIQKGGFRTGISGADPNCCRALGKSTSTKKMQTAVGGGGGPITKPKPPVSAPVEGAPAQLVGPNCKKKIRPIYYRQIIKVTSLQNELSGGCRIYQTGVGAPRAPN